MHDDHTLEQLMDALHEYAEEVAHRGDYNLEEVAHRGDYTVEEVEDIVLD